MVPQIIERISTMRSKLGPGMSPTDDPPELDPPPAAAALGGPLPAAAALAGPLGLWRLK